MSKEKRNNIISGLICFGLGLYIFISGLTMKAPEKEGFVGSAFFPKCIGILMIVLSLSMVIINALKKSKSDDALNVTDEEKKEENDNKCLIYTVILLIGYMLLLTRLGFLLTSIVYLLIQMLVMANKITVRNILLYAVISIVVVSFTNYIFVNVFDLMVPSGTWLKGRI